MKTIPAFLVSLMLAGQAGASVILLTDNRSVRVSGYVSDTATFADTQIPSAPFEEFDASVNGLASSEGEHSFASAGQQSVITNERFSLSAVVSGNCTSGEGYAASIFGIGFLVEAPQQYTLTLYREGFSAAERPMLLSSTGDVLPPPIPGYPYTYVDSPSSMFSTYEGVLSPGVYALRLDEEIRPRGEMHDSIWSMDFKVSGVPDSASTGLLLPLALFGLIAIRRKVTA